ncbi:4-(cytidine 5'-diphospho)-2-C-methyl-D-erythritol kinase [Acinetobacter sp. B5B]|uniref:4-(cytidine 5'-diphospho)-2-C-methyl-D-erythritol kinase n=1 Tax=Acinetobacter baretiae TaxID=2605383 RepID=UPI0018C1F08B|nr:4-(cytidine 5'-diphospho)-2-C-methyl-D-erythritol kinase [Acinetobacter baretiae]MBF7683359.1 4-(cytidine 5'-diphospho)-2-C-methyl-D-erythritol kinase [Acinetobacter baretiae]MBF7684340.1 4-(cytidine 5'-diphospho)-2-C-methyl-D-erythritol kinase [Acinetobacter baretiae]
MQIKVPSPAKLNLFLHITGRRSDGYHEIQTIFQLIDLYDWLTFTPTHTSHISIDGVDIQPQDNLIYKAAQCLKDSAKNHHGVHIQLEKNIPMGAGLGGGSSNAATTLIALNTLWNCGKSTQQLADIAATLGADIPLFIHGQNAWAEGIGERITPINLPQKQFIVLKPDCFISTQLLFSQKTLTRDAKPSKFCAYQQQPSIFGNCFEPLAKKLYPEVNEALLYLNQFGEAKLTGTGACVFVEVKSNMNTHDILSHSPCKSYMVNSLNISPVHDIFRD